MPSIQLHVVWDVTHKEKESGEILSHTQSPNLVVNVGREYILRDLFNLSGTDFLYMGAGSSSTTATVSDTRLTYELIGNADRKNLLNTSGGALDPSDIETGPYTVNAQTYYKRLSVQVEYDGDTDGNVDQVFQEYGIFSSDTLPGTPTSTSGLMFNHYIAPSPITLTAGSTLTITANIYV